MHCVVCVLYLKLMKTKTHMCTETAHKCLQRHSSQRSKKKKKRCGITYQPVADTQNAPWSYTKESNATRAMKLMENIMWNERKPAMDYCQLWTTVVLSVKPWTYYNMVGLHPSLPVWGIGSQTQGHIGALYSPSLCPFRGRVTRHMNYNSIKELPRIK